MFVQTPHFSWLLHFATRPGRCLLPSTMPFFHNGTFRPSRDATGDGTGGATQDNQQEERQGPHRDQGHDQDDQGLAKTAKASPKTRGASGRRSASSGKSAKSAGAREVTIDRRRTAGRRREDKDAASKPSQPPKSTAPAPKLETP